MLPFKFPLILIDLWEAFRSKTNDFTTPDQFTPPLSKRRMLKERVVRQLFMISASYLILPHVTLKLEHSL